MQISAIEWVATQEPKFDAQPLLLLTQHGAKFHPYTRPYAFEGHPAQTLALLSETHLPVDFQFKIGDKQVTLSDILNNTTEAEGGGIYGHVDIRECDAEDVGGGVECLAVGHVEFLDDR